MSKSKDFSFKGPDKTVHNFNIPIFEAGSVPPGGYVVCDCKDGRHHVFHSAPYGHRINLGEIKLEDATIDDNVTYKYYFSFLDEKVHKMNPTSTEL